MGVTITINAVDRTASIPFSDSPTGAASWVEVTETVPGIATAKMRIYDPTNSITINRLDPITVYDTTNSKNIFQGYVQKRTIEVVATYRWIHLDCVDLNAVMDTTLVGVPNGTNWTLTGNQYAPADPYATVQGGTDAAAIQALFTHYWVYPVSIDTTTYVTVTNPSIGYPDGITWSRTTMKQAANDIASLATPYTVGWIDADAKLHWTNKPQAGAPTGPTQSGTASGDLLMLFPYTTSTPLAQATYNLSDSPDNITTISYEDFSVEYDDTGGAFALYANGATDYTRTISGLTPDGITPAAAYGPGPANPYNAYYTATLTVAPINIYSVDTSGCIHQPAWTYGTVGQVLHVNPKYVTPCSTGGGHFWEIKDGTAGTIPNGYLIPQTNTTVQIAPITSTATGTTDVIGTGGTGWVNSAAPSWLSRYIDLPNASSQADRDSQGSVALQYMSQSVVRGKCSVVRSGILYRAGMGVYITSVPGGLSNSLQMIQRVTTTFLSGTDERRAALEWGTAALGNIGLRRNAQKKAPTQLGALQHQVTVKNTNPMPGSTVTVYTQLTNSSGQPIAVANKVVDWTVQVFDSTGNDVTTSSQGGTSGWTQSATSSVTDIHGTASMQLKLATTTGYQYFITATSPD